VPKGLRSFDAADRDFFLELLPGPLDREGLPESLRFWKTRAEETDADRTFAVGLLYGPSGCGKSSLVKAGLLPRLADHVAAVYVEAAGEGTEARLLRGLRRRVPGLPADRELVDSVAALRRGEGLEAGKKVLIVLDQFEQWLHARRGEENSELVRALRQCDGGRVQCLLLVRDDFWMAATRILQELEFRLVEGENSAAVDLFDARHAKKVLAKFGRAYGALPGRPGELTGEHDRFLDKAVKGLTQDGKVIPVRLALFAEMVKGKEWTPATLRAVGGAEGVGVTFLEQAFSASTAPPGHRPHQKAAPKVLKALLPEQGTDIRGAMRSRGELLTASGYAGRPRAFDELLDILNRELRLVSPSDPERSDSDSPSVQSRTKESYYQLTHDYLVPSIREWLSRKQKETERGRAELRLADRAALWNSSPENRRLPSWWEWARIRLLTRARKWTPPERKMMRAADNYYLARSVVVAAVLCLAAWGVREYLGRLEARSLLARLRDAPTANTPDIVKQMAGYRRWVEPLLRGDHAKADASNEPGDRQRLKRSLALLPWDDGQVEYLYGRLLEARPEDFSAIRGQLATRKADLIKPLRGELEKQENDLDRRFRAACALAEYDPQGPQWDQFGGVVAEKLVTENSLALGYWKDALKDVGGRLLPPLADMLERDGLPDAERRTIATLYREYSRARPDAIDALEDKFRDEQPRPGESKAAAAKRRANVGSALAAMGHGADVWPRLAHSPDPTLRTYLIERLGPGGADPRQLEGQLEQVRHARTREPDVSICRALILALGSMGPGRLPQAERDRLTPKMVELYREHPDPGVHGAARWALGQWQKGDTVWTDDKFREIDEELAELRLDKELAEGRLPNDWGWYVNQERQAFVVVNTPADARAAAGGAVAAEMFGRRFAIAATEVMVKEFCKAFPGHKYGEKTAPRENCPVNLVSWYEAAAYCDELSKQDGIARQLGYYEPNKAGEYAEGMRITPDPGRRMGYRLPTDSEWEHAARAGASTRWSCGEVDEETLGRYARMFHNSYDGSEQRTFPVGSLKPNDLGLFDMHGNVSEWCQDVFSGQSLPPGSYLPPAKGDGSEVFNSAYRVFRGGSFLKRARDARSDKPGWARPGDAFPAVGFRPARTIR
jgi:formylglycine-generating enzyme required for sulfatase activity